MRADSPRELASWFAALLIPGAVGLQCYWHVGRGPIVLTGSGFIIATVTLLPGFGCGFIASAIARSFEASPRTDPVVTAIAVCSSSPLATLAALAAECAIRGNCR